MNCRHCDKELEWYRGRIKLYCNQKCHYESRKEYYKKRYQTLKPKTRRSRCPTCGKLTNDKFCSSDCYPRHKKWQAVRRYKKTLDNLTRIIPTIK